MNDSKDKKITLRINNYVWHLWENKAKQKNISVSEYIRNMASIEIYPDMILKEYESNFNGKSEAEILESMKHIKALYRRALKNIDETIDRLNMMKPELEKSSKQAEKKAKDLIYYFMKAMDKEKNKVIK